LHQFLPLIDVLNHLRASKNNGLVQRYLNYKKHVSRTEYSDASNALQKRLLEKEKAWPEYEHSKKLVSQPAFLTQRSDSCFSPGLVWTSAAALVARSGEAKEWAQQYLAKHVQSVQEHRQHHVHLPDPKTGEPMPLTHCQRRDNPKLCKGDFPRSRWLIEQPVVLCKGLLERMGMAVSGRKNKLGGLHGPMNHDSVNGTHPAMLAVHTFNSDVQLPYRFPITEDSHCDATLCPHECIGKDDDLSLLAAVQMGQDAQAGYACDYCTKRQPMAFNEVKECCKGHMVLNEAVSGKELKYIGKRHMLRLMSDAYGKGIVRGHVENTNLRAYGDAHDVTKAESFVTDRATIFPGAELLSMIEHLNDKKDLGKRASR
jgi:hypothetical protein